MNCGNCKHWLYGDDAETDEVEHEGGFGECALAKCEKGQPLVKTLCYGNDGSAYAAWLVTHRTFGCVQFESK